MCNLLIFILHFLEYLLSTLLLGPLRKNRFFFSLKHQSSFKVFSGGLFKIVFCLQNFLSLHFPSLCIMLIFRMYRKQSEITMGVFLSALWCIFSQCWGGCRPELCLGLSPPSVAGSWLWSIPLWAEPLRWHDLDLWWLELWRKVLKK